MENGIIKKGITNIKYLICSQIVSYTLSFLTSFVLPGLLGVEANGYYQVYMFYTSYVGILHFGFNDGIYLKYGGSDYSELPHELFRSYMRFYVILTGSQILIFGGASFLESDPQKRFAFYFVILNILVVNFSNLFNYINQITGRIKKYSFAVVAEKLQIVIFILLLFALRKVNFKYVILCDFTAKAVVLLFNIFNARDIIFGRSSGLRSALPDCVDNISVGMKLMVANLMGMLVLGIGRFIVERFSTVSDFSLYSFAVLSINLAMMFVSSVSLILYPMLCRLDKNTLPNYFTLINRLLTAFIFCMLLLYYPLVLAIDAFLPKYSPVISYLYLLFPVVIMQSKMQLLNNTYYKSLREEKAMMVANLSSVIMFILLAVPLYYFFPSIKVIVWVTLATFTWRCYSSELYLKKKMGLHSNGNIVQELIMAVVFILTASLLNGTFGILIYTFFAGGYLFINRAQLIANTKKLISKAGSR